MAPFVAEQFPIFQPAMRKITAITNARLAEVTTSFAHNYLTGTIIRLVIPKGFGMQQANKLFSEIVVTSPTTFTMLIDTSTFDPFVIPGGDPQYAQSLAIGENSFVLAAAEQNVLPY